MENWEIKEEQKEKLEDYCHEWINNNCMIGADKITPCAWLSLRISQSSHRLMSPRKVAHIMSGIDGYKKLKLYSDGRVQYCWIGFEPLDWAVDGNAKQEEIFKKYIDCNFVFGSRDECYIRVGDFKKILSRDFVGSVAVLDRDRWLLELGCPKRRIMVDGVQVWSYVGLRPRVVGVDVTPNRMIS